MNQWSLRILSSMNKFRTPPELCKPAALSLKEIAHMLKVKLASRHVEVNNSNYPGVARSVQHRKKDTCMRWHAWTRRIKWQLPGHQRIKSHWSMPISSYDKGGKDVFHRLLQWSSPDFAKAYLEPKSVIRNPVMPLSHPGCLEIFIKKKKKCVSLDPIQ